MSLGVLNNLSAVYAENYLNNTNNSLNTVLEQLSSGSKINSGADDAAGLSLVNGLQANQQALNQSKTNASEGVGLLQVADGALSQVTSLLNRAVTLATESANGTLNSTQDQAANQEYQSILSEISNIGSTTTYNQEQVFNSNTNIYTGDASAAGSAVDALNIRSLSSTNIGDSTGAMAYSNGQNNVFIDLSNAGKNAAVSDSLGASTATTTIAVGYLTAGSNGAAVTASANISVGAGTNYANTAQGLISAINNSGLGITAIVRHRDAGWHRSNLFGVGRRLRQHLGPDQRHRHRHRHQRPQYRRQYRIHSHYRRLYQRRRRSGHDYRLAGQRHAERHTQHHRFHRQSARAHTGYHQLHRYAGQSDVHHQQLRMGRHGVAQPEHRDQRHRRGRHTRGKTRSSL